MGPTNQGGPLGESSFRSTDRRCNPMDVEGQGILELPCENQATQLSKLPNRHLSLNFLDGVKIQNLITNFGTI